MDNHSENLPENFKSPEKMASAVHPPRHSGKRRDEQTSSGRPNMNPRNLFSISVKNQKNIG